MSPVRKGGAPGALVKLAFTQLAVEVSDKNENAQPAIVQAAMSQSVYSMPLQSIPKQSAAGLAAPSIWLIISGL